MRTVNVLYRVKRYGKWKPLKVTLTAEENAGENRHQAIKQAITKEIGNEPTEFRTV